MKRLFVFIITLVLYNCRIEDIVVKETAQFFLNDQKESSIQGPVSASESCNGLSITSIDFKNTLPVYSLDVQLTRSGRLISLILRTKEGKRYETQTFNPENAVNITDFNYNKSTEEVSFNLKGKLNTALSSNSINISGRFKNVPVKTHDCDPAISEMMGEVQGNTKSFVVETLSGVSAIRDGNNGSFGDTYIQNFLLTNSFLLRFESAVSFKSLKVGSYKIGTSSSIKVSLQEYKGLSDPNNLNTYVPNDWRDFSLDGTLTITRQFVTNGTPYTEGTISFQAVNDTDNIQYSLKQGSFTLLNF